MSIANIVCDTRMNLSVLFVFCCAIIFQVTYAAPIDLAEGGNPLFRSAVAGDFMLKIPEPLNLTGISTSIAGSGPGSFTANLNDSVDQVVGDRILPPNGKPATIIPNGNTSTSLLTSLPTASTDFATSSDLPGTLTTETTTSASPLDSQITISSGPATTTSLAVADPLLFYKLLTNMLHHQEQFMQSLYSPFSGIASPFSGIAPPFSGQMPPFSGMMTAGFPGMQMPNFRAQIPSVPVGFNDSSLKLVDQKVIDEGDLKGQVNTYEGQPDPNTVSKLQTSQFSVNKDGLQGVGLGHSYSSSSSSSSSGGNPVVSWGTLFGSLPRFNMGFPLRLT